MSEYAFEEQQSFSTAGLAKAVGGGQIPREIDRQGQVLEELHNLISHLEERLGPVRLAKPEPGTAERDQPEPIRADVAQAIAMMTTRAQQATRRIQTLLNELEL